MLGGPVVGGAITQGIAWEWIFWLNVPIGLVLAPLALRRMGESYGPPARLDVPGLVLVTGGALGLVWGLVRGNAAGWASAEVLGALGGRRSRWSPAFVAWERRAPRADAAARPVPRPAPSRRATRRSSSCSPSLFGAVFFMAQFLQIAQGHGPLDAGVRLLPWTATLFVVAPLAGARVSRVGERPFIAGGLLLQAVGMAWIALIAEPGVAYGRLVAPLVLAGAGVSMAMPAAQSAVVGAVARDQIGRASATFNALRQLGGAFGVAILVAVFAGGGRLRLAAGVRRRLRARDRRVRRAVARRRGGGRGAAGVAAGGGSGPGAERSARVDVRAERAVSPCRAWPRSRRSPPAARRTRCAARPAPTSCRSSS